MTPAPHAASRTLAAMAAVVHSLPAPHRLQKSKTRQLRFGEDARLKAAKLRRIKRKAAKVARRRNRRS